MPNVIDQLWERVRQGDPTAFGAVPPPLSTKDFTYTPRVRVPGAAPSRFQHSAVGKVPVLNQQGGTCVGNSVAGALMYLEWLEKGEVVPFDAEALNARVTHHEDQATWASLVLDAVLAQGIPSGGGLYFPKAYAKLDPHDIDAIKLAMSTPGNALVGAFSIYGADIANDPNCWGVFPKQYYDPTPNPNNVGYHEMLYAGYDELGVLLQNSWDNSWGDGGFARASWHYITTQCYDLVVITDSADNAGGFVKTYTPPNPTELRAIKRADLPDRKRPAVYQARSNGRFWVKDIWEAKRMGVDLTKVETLPDTDDIWTEPVIGLDAPKDQR